MDKKLLEVSSPGTLKFSKTKKTQEITLTNVSKVDVTFKLQSTVYGRFSMRPRWGVLKPNDYTDVLITMSKDAELSKKGRDKILVICMPAPINEVDFDLTASFWRHNICYDPKMEKHQLTCLEENGDDEKESTPGDCVGCIKDPKEANLLRARTTVAKHWR
ncbi:uncharacterized protein [Drosophila kikkawai]|uniref:Uncharacterized protein LOC108071909 n=1 Tax=Drosophila kikkawai TaxID=30033 RepID=A0A6P4I6P3_DROKI|nr:uncharacterized protein LOC108071909 [Drosophila kikkawai]